ncbi:unnamed protein product [Rhodiola kirilowii]
MAETLVSLMAKLSWLAIRDWIIPMLDLSQTIDGIMLELRSADAFLKTVDGYEDMDLQQVRYIDEVRDLANQVEDAIDEYILLCSETIIKQTKNVRDRYSIATTVGVIKPKFEQARKRLDMHDKKPFISNGSTFENGSSSTSSVSKSQRWYNPQDDGHFDEELIGREDSKAELIQKLVDDGVKELRMIPVVALGGMGKTSLVRKVFEDAKFESHFKSHIWINFSTNSKPEELFKEMIEKLCEESKEKVPESLATMKSLDMKLKIKSILNEKKYLIVLDDVQALDKWNACCPVFPKNDLGSRVIITTHGADVVQGSKDHIYHLKPLSDEYSRRLFSSKAFKDGGECPGQLLQVQDSILAKCGGMPLGIKTIGSLLRDKKQTVAEWSEINNSLGKEMKGNLISIDKILSRCYHDISHDLKPCFMYMSIFPGDHLIGHLKLIRLWVAEGFVAHCEGKTADDVAENYLSELLSRSLIQVAERRSDGRVKSYRIHGLMRVILTTKSKDQNFVARDKSIDSYSKVRRLSVQNRFVNHQGTLGSLRSLLLFDMEERLDKSTMPVLFNGMSKLLTVLDLQGAKVAEFPLAITNLLNLRYLSLRDTMVKDIPSSIGRLRKLETLDLKRTMVQKLPNQMKHLQQLQNLLLYQYGDDKNGAFPSKRGFQAPKGIRALTSLQKLCFIEADKDSGRIVQELGELRKLRRLGIVKLSTKHEGALWSSIQKMTQLRALSVTASNGETMNLLGLQSPPVCLERLYLTGALKSFPQWIRSPSLQNLVKIFLKSSDLDEEPLEKLGNLKNLLHIELQQVYSGPKLCFKLGKFQKLKILGLRKLEKLQTVAIEENSMPKLEKFLIQECTCLMTLPQGIKQLSKLKELDFVLMPLVLKTLMTVPGDDYGSIQHIPQVNFATYVDQVWIIERVPTLMKDPSSSEVEPDKQKQLDKELQDFREK